MQHAQPVQLEKLAMKLSCDFLIQECRKIVTVPEPRAEDRESVLKAVNIAITKIQDLVFKYIPSTLANEWLQMFLIDFDIQLLPEVSRRSTYQWRRMLIHDIVLAIIPPSITELYCNRRWNFLLPEIYSALKSMKNLQHIKLGYQRDITNDELYGEVVFEEEEEEDEEEESLLEWEEDTIISGIRYIDRLASFSFARKCTDKIIRALADFHPRLYGLRLDHCRDVTDNILPKMLRFRCLQVLSLIGTGLSDSAVITLLSQLPNGPALRSYSHHNATEAEIALLVEQCPNLSCVELMADGCQDVAPLKRLHNLKRLSLSHLDFDCLREVLLVIGDQLLELELFLVVNVDVPFIGSTCWTLKHLTISFCDDPVPVPDEEFVAEPSPLGLNSLSQVELVVDDCLPLVTYVLGHCSNLKIADVNVRGYQDDRIVADILKRNDLKKLEQLRWISSSISELTFQGAREILKHCRKLSLFVGPEIWRSEPQYKSFLREMKAKYPGCQLS